MKTETIPTATVVPQNNPAAAYGGYQVKQELVFASRDQLDAMLSNRESLFVEQQLELLESVAQQIGCACIEQQNRYFVYDFNTGERLLEFKESSNPFERCCCRPYHAANIYGFDARQESPTVGQVLLQIYKPFKCGCCPACIDFCQVEGTFFLPDGTKEQNGIAGEVFGKSKVPQFGGGFTPTVTVMDRNGESTGKITGPTCIYGGCLEYCQDQNFQLYVRQGPIHQANGGVVKLRPRELEATIRDAVTDADKFKIIFPSSATDDDRARLVGTMILLDYLFFETGGAVQFNPPGCTLCNFYCLGCVCPFHVECNNDNGGGGE